MVSRHIFLALAVFLFLFSSITAFANNDADRLAANFANPLVKAPISGCADINLKADRFSESLTPTDRLHICESIANISNELNAGSLTQELRAELGGIWKTFTSEKVFFKALPKGSPSLLLAQAEPFPNGIGRKFESVIYLNPDKLDKKEFLYVFLHEMRHVYDFEQTWRERGTINSIELERRAFLLMGAVMEEFPDHGGTDRLPRLWKKAWCKLSKPERIDLRNRAVDEFLNRSKTYQRVKELNASLDFRYLKQHDNYEETESLADTASFMASEKKVDSVPVATVVAASYEKKGERLPPRYVNPNTREVIKQNVEELPFKLEKPRNAKDADEVLRVALRNEKTLYYGMDSFVYEQTAQVECWKKNKLVATFKDQKTIARTDAGKRLDGKLIQAAEKAAPCVQNYGALQADFADTFWASPALEFLPIRFFGFVQEDGKTLARYSVLQPSNDVLDSLRKRFPEMNPFRVFTGSIYVSPEDGQIVKFWGSGYPEKELTGYDSKKIHGSYVATALRQKTSNGIWLPTFVGIVAVSSGNNDTPFRYAVKYENYRQAVSDVKILDDEEVIAGVSNR